MWCDVIVEIVVSVCLYQTCLTAMQFGQLLTHLDTTQQMINNSLKDNNTLLTQVGSLNNILFFFFFNLCLVPFYQLVTRCALHSLLPQVIITRCVHYSIFQLFSPAFFQSGPTDDEGEPGGHRGELCCTRPEDEEGFQINIIIVWAGPGVIKTWTSICWPESTEGQQGLKSVLFVCSWFALFFASAFLSLRGMLRVGKDWKTQKKTKHTSPPLLSTSFSCIKVISETLHYIHATGRSPLLRLLSFSLDLFL